MQTASNSLTLQNRLRLMTAISLLAMLAVAAFVTLNLDRMRREFVNYQSMQVMDKSLIEIKAEALSVSRNDPVLPDSAGKLDAADSRIGKLVARIGTLSEKASVSKELATVTAKWQAYVQGFRGAIKIASDSPADALQIPDSLYSTDLVPLAAKLDELVVANRGSETESRKQIGSLMQEVLLIVLLPLVALGLLTALTQTFFGRYLARRLEIIVKGIGHLQNGDLGYRLPVQGGDELDRLSVTVNQFIERYGKILGEVKDSADLTSRTAREVGDKAGNVTVNAKEQSSRIFEVREAVEGMGSTVTKIAENAANASQSASRAQELVRSGSRTGQSTIASLGRIEGAFASSTRTISELDSAIRRIGAVSTLIRDIADQTNLLALNAAIEAARAGEQGRGFAVVADEVRKLAERTSSATSDITRIVHEIESETGEATTAMSLAMEEVAQGVRHGEEMGRLLSRMDEAVEGVTSMMREIAAATEQQSASAERVRSNMDSVAGLSASTASEIERALGEMLSLENASQSLQEAVGQFRI